MSKIIPVMVHHETGEKAQAAGKKNQEYLKYCIAQAKKYNEKDTRKGLEEFGVKHIEFTYRL